MEVVAEGEVLRNFDYSVRVNLANSSLCGGRQRSVVLKLHLERPDGSERQVGGGCIATDCLMTHNFLVLVQVVLELDDKQLTRLLRDFGRIHQELQKHS